MHAHKYGPKGVSMIVYIIIQNRVFTYCAGTEKYDFTHNKMCITDLHIYRNL